MGGPLFGWQWKATTENLQATQGRRRLRCHDERRYPPRTSRCRLGERDRRRGRPCCGSKTTEANGLEADDRLQAIAAICGLHIEPFLGASKLTALDRASACARSKRSYAPAADRRRQSARCSSRWDPCSLMRRNAAWSRATSSGIGVIAARAIRRQEQRQKGKLKVGVDIPTPGEIRAFVAALDGRWRPVLLTAVFTGLRASELRGLPWKDVDLDRAVIHVRQRADRLHKIGPPKSASSERTIPLPPIVVNTLKEWRLACPRGPLGLVFPTGAGNVESHKNITARGLHPAMLTAGVTVDTGKLDKDGAPVLAAKYTGLHCLRHFFASWLINARSDGGLELSPKVVQERLGHSTIAMTLDVYSHLFPRNDDGDELMAAEHALLHAT